MDENVKKYLVKKSGHTHPALIAAYVQVYADYFRKLAREASYSVGRNFSAEVPPELEQFVADADKNKD